MLILLNRKIFIFICICKSGDIQFEEDLRACEAARNAFIDTPTLNLIRQTGLPAILVCAENPANLKAMEQLVPAYLQNGVNKSGTRLKELIDVIHADNDSPYHYTDILKNIEKNQNTKDLITNPLFLQDFFRYLVVISRLDYTKDGLMRDDKLLRWRIEVQMMEHTNWNIGLFEYILTYMRNASKYLSDKSKILKSYKLSHYRIGLHYVAQHKKLKKFDALLWSSIVHGASDNALKIIRLNTETCESQRVEALVQIYGTLETVVKGIGDAQLNPCLLNHILGTMNEYKQHLKHSLELALICRKRCVPFEFVARYFAPEIINDHFILTRISEGASIEEVKTYCQEDKKFYRDNILQALCKKCKLRNILTVPCRCKLPEFWLYSKRVWMITSGIDLNITLKNIKEKIQPILDVADEQSKKGIKDTIRDMPEFICTLLSTNKCILHLVDLSELLPLLEIIEKTLVPQEEFWQKLLDAGLGKMRVGSDVLALQKPYPPHIICILESIKLAMPDISSTEEFKDVLEFYKIKRSRQTISISANRATWRLIELIRFTYVIGVPEILLNELNYELIVALIEHNRQKNMMTLNKYASQDNLNDMQVKIADEILSVVKVSDLVKLEKPSQVFCNLFYKRMKLRKAELREYLNSMSHKELNKFVNVFDQYPDWIIDCIPTKYVDTFVKTFLPKYPINALKWWKDHTNLKDSMQIGHILAEGIEAYSAILPSQNFFQQQQSLRLLSGIINANMKLMTQEHHQDFQIGLTKMPLWSRLEDCLSIQEHF